MTTETSFIDNEIDADAKARLEEFERNLDRNMVPEQVGRTTFPSAHEQRKNAERLQLLLVAHFRNQAIADRTSAAFEKHKSKISG